MTGKEEEEKEECHGKRDGILVVSSSSLTTLLLDSLTLLEPSGSHQRNRRKSQKLVAHDWPRATLPNQTPAPQPERCVLPKHNNRGLGGEYEGAMASPRRRRDAGHG